MTDWGDLYEQVHGRPPKAGPIRWTDTERRCTCGSSAYVRVDGVPRCMKHALDDAILLLDRLAALDPERATRVLTNGTTSGAARALAKDVLKLTTP